MFDKKTINDSEVPEAIRIEIARNFGRCQVLMRQYFQEVQLERGQEPNFIQMMVFTRIFKNIFDNF